ncbi:MAG: hypothetical protein JNL98_02735 [Bryobacterales bacterium]|nr:hypothetical protein [Bryobacterales bacterium]
MIDKLDRRMELNRDLGPQRCLIVRTAKTTHGLFYTGLLRWEGDNSKLVLYFATVVVTITGQGLLDRYGSLLADNKLRHLSAPARTDRFHVTHEGSEGVERIDVVRVDQS